MCGNSATTLRLLAGALAASGTPAVLTGSAGLSRRPMGRIVLPLRQMGVPINGVKSSTGEETAPLEISARSSTQRLDPIQHTLSIASAQVKSCLLLAALAAGQPSVIEEPGPSRDHTERMLRSMGVQLASQPIVQDGRTSYQVVLTPPNGRALTPLNTTLPGDFSSAAFLIVAALITPGSEITLQRVGLNPLRTGLLDALLSMSADIQITSQSEQGGEPVGDLIIRHSRLHGTQVAGDLVVRMIDEFPIFTVAAAYANGWTEVRDAVELRHKESDRISMLSTELRTLGVDVTETSDGFLLHGGQPLKGGSVHPHGDHRLAMSLAVAGLAAQQPVTVQDADIFTESFPGFTDILRSFGAVIAINV
jgi:3-phosphoshikimate 1-carboxyvinyltransferase